MDFSSKSFCSDEELLLSENTSTGTRIFLFFLGLLPLLAPYELLLRPRWKEFSLGMPFIAIICAGAISISFGFFMLASRGEDRILRFDARRKTIIYRCKSPFTAMKEKNYSFHEVLRTEIKTHEGDSSPDDYGIEITFKDNEKINVGHLLSKEEIRLYQNKIHAWLH